jgi:hypothetical protein
VVATIDGERREITKRKAVGTQLDGEPHHKAAAILGGETSRQRPGVMLPHISFPSSPASGEARGSAPRSDELTDATPAWPAIGGSRWLQQDLARGSANSPLVTAIRCGLRHWNGCRMFAGLSSFLDDRASRLTSTP